MVSIKRVLLFVAVLMVLAPTLDATGWSGGWKWDQNYDVDGLPVWWEATYTRFGIWVDVEIELECDMTYVNRSCCNTIGGVFFIEDNIVDSWNPGLTAQYTGQASWQNDTLSSGGWDTIAIKGKMEITQ